MKIACLFLPKDSITLIEECNRFFEFPLKKNDGLIKSHQFCSKGSFEKRMLQSIIVGSFSGLEAK